MDITRPAYVFDIDKFQHNYFLIACNNIHDDIVFVFLYDPILLVLLILLISYLPQFHKNFILRNLIYV